MQSTLENFLIRSPVSEYISGSLNGIYNSLSRFSTSLDKFLYKIAIDEFIIGSISGIGYALLSFAAKPIILIGTWALLVSNNLRGLCGIKDVFNYFKNLVTGKISLSIELTSLMAGFTFIITQIAEWGSVIPFLADHIHTAISSFCSLVLPRLIDIVCLPAYLVIFSALSYDLFNQTKIETQELNKLKQEHNYSELKINNPQSDIVKLIKLKESLINNKIKFMKMCFAVLAVTVVSASIIFCPFSLPIWIHVCISVLFSANSFFSVYMFGHFKKDKIENLEKETEEFEKKLQLKNNISITAINDNQFAEADTKQLESKDLDTKYIYNIEH